MDTQLNGIFQTLLESVNITLTAGTVVIAVSLLLYNLSRNLRNRVARSSGIVLGCVTFAYLCDSFITLGPDPAIQAIALRLQWLGIAFIPAAMFHLSDALLATTGLPSRGRRRRIVRILYLFSSAIFVLAILTDTIVSTQQIGRDVTFVAEEFFFVYVLFFATANMVAFINVQRARHRCLTRSTERRMAYLQIAILTPAFGIFPYSGILETNDENWLIFLLLINIANLVVILMLIFLSYPLSFFGSNKPDRVVKVELLRFLLRGPGTGLLALGTIEFTSQATRIFGLRGEDFMPFAVVGVVLFWQWTIDLAMPGLEKWLVYNQEDDEQMSKLQDLSERLLTRNDLVRMVEATLEATCDSMRVSQAFAASINDGELQIVSSVGTDDEENEWLHNQQAEWLAMLADIAEADEPIFLEWNDYLISPLYSVRANGSSGNANVLIGIMGIRATPELLDTDDDLEKVLATYRHRIEVTLDDTMIQSEIFAALEGLLPQISTTRARADEIEYRAGRQSPRAEVAPHYDDFVEQVRAALRHYWGGPGISRSKLIELQIVQKELHQSDSSVQALRNVLQMAIDKLRPESPRSMTGPEWTLFNIIELRFIERKKVRDVARRMSMSESDLYRKQRLAIEAVANMMLELERESLIISD